MGSGSNTKWEAVYFRRPLNRFGWRLFELEFAGPQCCKSARDTVLREAAANVRQRRGRPQGVPLRGVAGGTVSLSPNYIFYRVKLLT